MNINSKLVNIIFIAASTVCVVSCGEIQDLRNSAQGQTSDVSPRQENDAYNTQGNANETNEQTPKNADSAPVVTALGAININKSTWNSIDLSWYQKEANVERVTVQLKAVDDWQDIAELSRADPSFKVGGLERDTTYELRLVSIANDNDKHVSASTIAKTLPSPISAGYGHFLLVDDQGDVWAAGSGRDAIGRTEPFFSETLIKVNGVSDVIAVSAGGHSLALKADGTVWAWGSNFYSQLGAGPSTPIPRKIVGLDQVKSIWAGKANSFAIKEDGSLWMWGKVVYGNGVFSVQPKQITQLKNVVAVQSAELHAAALDADGGVWVWGRGDRIGDGLNIDRAVPVKIIDDVKKISLSGFGASLALKNDGSLWAWGNNGHGNFGVGIGDNQLSGSAAPMLVPGFTNISTMAGGVYYFNTAVDADGNVWGWGWSGDGNLGTGSDGAPFFATATPLRVAGATKIKTTSCGFGYTIAIDESGDLYAWGQNMIFGYTNFFGNLIPNRQLVPLKVTQSDMPKI